jgi:hypothetical protein
VYLHSRPEASSVIDLIRRTCRRWWARRCRGGHHADGYSQGADTRRWRRTAPERNNATEITVVAGAHLAGLTTCLACSTVNVNTGISTLCPSVTAWQSVYGNIPHQRGCLLPTYATGIETLLPSPTLNFTTPVTTGNRVQRVRRPTRHGRAVPARSLQIPRSTPTTRCSWRQA